MAKTAFFDAYVTCALWSSTDNSTEQGGEPFDQNYGPEDIAPDTLKRMREDCDAFQRDQRDLLALIDASDEQNGHDFWLTRNGHGAGFWDRGYGVAGRELSEACKPWGTFDLYLGDDGKIHGA
jgi:hypothetical protein